MGKLAIFNYMYCRSLLQHVQWRSFKTKNQSFLFSTTQNNLFHIMWRMAIITVHTCMTCPSKSFMWTVHGPNVVFCCILFCCCVVSGFVLCCVLFCLLFPQLAIHLDCILETTWSLATSTSTFTTSTLTLSFSKDKSCVSLLDYGHTKQPKFPNLHPSCFSMRNCKAMAASTMTGGSVSSVKQIRAEFTAVARFLSSLKVMSPKLCNTQHA